MNLQIPTAGVGLTSESDRQIFLIRVTLGLNPIHDPVAAVRVLLEEGREAFETLRGMPCEHAHKWKPD